MSSIWAFTIPLLLSAHPCMGKHLVNMTLTITRKWWSPQAVTPFCLHNVANISDEYGSHSSLLSNFQSSICVERLFSFSPGSQ